MKDFNGQDLEIAYRQISIFLAGIDNPFSDWEPGHVEQGFTLRLDAIGIMTISESGLIKTGVNYFPDILENAMRVFAFPFEVNGGKGVEISTIVNGFNVDVNDGKYSLLIQLGQEPNEGDWCWFSFVKSKDLMYDTPTIIKADDEITRRADFILSAKPA